MRWELQFNKAYAIDFDEISKLIGVALAKIVSVLSMHANIVRRSGWMKKFDGNKDPLKKECQEI